MINNLSEINDPRLQENTEENHLLAQHRCNLYHFLSRIFIEEVSSDFLDQLQNPDNQEAFQSAGIDISSHGLEEDKTELLETLAASYCEMFILGNIAGLQPYESAQLEGRLQGDLTEAVECFYREYQLEVEAPNRNLPDHLGIELSFMGKLAQMEAQYWKQGDLDGALEAVEGQRRFLQSHLLVWLPRYSKSLERLATHPLYQGAGTLVYAFLEMEADVFSLDWKTG